MLSYTFQKQRHFLGFRQISCCFIALLLTHIPVSTSILGSLRRRRLKPYRLSVCELVHIIVFESRRVARRYVGVIDWLVSYAVCD